MGEPLRIMMIEDSESDFLLVKRALRTLQQETVCIRVDRISALDEALRLRDWDAILCDYNVPNMSFGSNLAMILSCLPDTPLILVSGDLGIEQATDLLRQGVWDFVLKDNLARLPSVLERALHEAADHDARRKAEEALRLSEERLRLAVEGAALGIWHLDVAAGQTTLSGLCCSMLGVPDAKLTLDGFVQLVHPDDRMAVEDGLRQALQTGRDYDAEYRILLPDGRERWLAAKAGVQRVLNGQAVSLEGVLQDITVRKMAEQALVQARESAEATNRAKTELLAIISHELRTPLNGVFGGVQLLKMTALDQEQQEYLGLVELSVGNELSLVNDLLDLAQTEAAGFSVISQEFALKRCLEDSIRIQSLPAKNRGLSLALTMRDDLPDRLLGDPLRLRQILLNLLGNAIKFTESGAITLQVAEAGRDQQGQRLLRFSVADTGIGIAAEDYLRIFNAFEQVDMSNSRRYGGAGLGLAICQRLTALLGGRIWVESKLGCGSTFFLELPFRVPETRQPEVKAPDVRKLPPGRILLVDDDHYNLKVNATLLEKLNLQVVTACNGNQAIEAWQQHQHQPFDLILLDIQMPDMTGMEVLARIRSLEKTAGTTSTPTVAVTAYAMPDDCDKILAAGFDAYLPKPLMVNRLVEVLSHILV